ncbi:PAS domain-containing protein [Hydrogenophaga sp.]|uniref:PAS domain-containing protein n=1 Tax=Hydrogenophaga sp. TaxID=1904254 RepID=UPI00271BD078|nr:PAS domain-containing protein [Hydrogenophaga sp.]MDO8906742.1 PAS domain-containing protein [Hydrogenophaga sp.]
MPSVNELSRQIRIDALIKTLHETERALEALNVGQVDTVANQADHIFPLKSTEDRLHQHEASKQMALLNALPAHIAVLDADGVIIAVNAAWRRFGNENGLRNVNHCVGLKYLDACGQEDGGGASDTETDSEKGVVAAGLRAVLAGERANFSIEYPCDSSTEQRWFMLMVTPLATGPLAGAVVMHIDISARARAEQSLRDSKAMLDMAGRSAKVGGWTFDLEHRRLNWSDMVTSLHDEPAGYSPSMEQGLASFVTEYRAAIQEAVECCAQFGVSYDVEAEKISATGRRFWVRTIGEAVRDVDGRIVRIQGALQDITERKLAALQTQKLAQQLSNTLESISDAFFALGHDWRITYFNREAERLLGRTRDTALGCVLWEIFPEAVGTVFHTAYQRAMDGETGVTFEAFYAPLNEWFGVDCHPSDDGLSVYFRTVTEARAARQQLKLLEASVAQLTDIVIITEPAPELAHGRRIVFVNDAFERLTGYARAEVLGRSPALFVGPVMDAAELDRIRFAVERFEPVHAELTACAKGGRQYPIEIDITPIAAAGEGVTHGVVVIRDISERRRNVQALRELNAGLEERVRQRTEELERARELAEQANRAKSSFLATMSHEIRTPMNGVIGMIEVLEESHLREDQRDMAKTVRESAYALLSVVDDVLDFSKIEAGQFMVDHAPMDVTAVVEGVGDALRQVAKNKGVGLRLYTDPRLPAHTLGDAGRLRQVLMNLVGNAIKFSSGQGYQGSVSLRAQRVVTDAGVDTLALVVTDNGVGMDADTLDRLFSPFTQADASTTRRFGGTGLGLSISHRLVAMMGGEITVSSVVDQGSTFTVRLPIAAAADVARPEQPLSGLPCLLLGAGDLVPDLADYLAHAGCKAQCEPTLSEGLTWLQGVTLGRCVAVVAGPPEGIEPVLTACRAVAMQRPGMRLGFVVIKAGRRRQPRRLQPDQVDIDGDYLHRAAFLHSVALAARLMLTQETAEIPAPVNAAAVLPLTERLTDAGLTILVAEDNEINQQVLAKQLGLLGYRAEMVGDGMQALARWRCGGHALLLTDLHMPNMDGYTLAAAVRREEGKGPRLPIIALTANALRDEEIRCRQAGMDAYLTKPVRLAQLKSAIDAWLRPTPTQSSMVELNDVASGAMPPVNLSVLADLLGDDAQVMQEVLTAFRASTRRSALAMEKAHEEGGVQAMSDVAHKLKSAARSIGAARLAQLCADIEENAACKPHAATLEPLMAGFKIELLAVQNFLDKHQGLFTP